MFAWGNGELNSLMPSHSNEASCGTEHHGIHSISASVREKAASHHFTSPARPLLNLDSGSQTKLVLVNVAGMFHVQILNWLVGYWACFLPFLVV